jgi:plastocyanin
MMNTFRGAVLAILLVFLVSPAGAQEVSGEIKLWDQKSDHLAKDASEVVVWLVPLNDGQRAHLDTSKRVSRMTQHNKKFVPHLLVVPVGSIISFPNLDPWFHNVFSLYRGKRFDLGLYEAGSQKEVRFDRPGPSYIFCNIHPEMMGVVLTIDSDLYAISNETGHWTIPDVPRGRYALHVWYENASVETLHSLERMVLVGDDGASLTALDIQVTPSEIMNVNHPNKYGRKYDPPSLAPVY